MTESPDERRERRQCVSCGSDIVWQPTGITGRYEWLDTRGTPFCPSGASNRKGRELPGGRFPRHMPLAREDEPEATPTSPKCICPRFKDTGGFRIADLACPVHGPGGTNPGDGYWDEPEATE